MKTLKFNLFTIVLIVLFGGIATTTTSCKKKKGCTDPKAKNYKAEATKDDGSCEYDQPAPTPTTGTLELKFEHVWGPSGATFSMNTALVHPSTSEELTFQTLKYYITNIKLKKTDGTWWTQTESYYLVDASSAAIPSFTIQGVPAGDYTDIKYMIGVDSTRNVSGAQSGALSTSNGMFWSWNSGYIFIKAEGLSPDSPNGAFTYHIGGFRDANNTNAIRINSQNLAAATLAVAPNASPSVHFKVNVARFWHGGLSVSTLNNVHMPGANALILADNFQGAINVDHIHN
ncbi:MAG: MbnP family protein [Flavobacteriales bacterium]